MDRMACRRDLDNAIRQRWNTWYTMAGRPLCGLCLENMRLEQVVRDRPEIVYQQQGARVYAVPTPF